MKPIRALFVSYPASFQNIGGGEILLSKLKAYLEKEGADVKLFDMWRDRVENYDIVHVFGSVKDCLGLIRVANARRVKVAITPIFWSSWNRAFNTYGSMSEKLEFFVRHAMKLLFPRFSSARRSMLACSDLIFPNSDMEKKQIHRLFAIPQSKMSVVYNGVDRGFLEADPELFRQRFGQEKFILSIGRIEPRKNQLNLIRAMRKTPGR